MKGFWGLFNQYFQRISKLKKWLQSRSLKRKEKRESGYVSWGLGVDVPYFSSSKFTIENDSITIIGSQRMLIDSWPVRYSIVKMSRLGISTKHYDYVVFYGNHSEDGFKHTFNIPSGEGYQLEVYNYFKFQTSGEFRIIQNET
jgi:hypothetical protein